MKIYEENKIVHITLEEPRKKFRRKFVICNRYNPDCDKYKYCINHKGYHLSDGLCDRHQMSCPLIGFRNKCICEDIFKKFKNREDDDNK